MDLDEDDELAIGVLQHLNAGPVTTAAALAAPGDGLRGRGRGRGRGRARVHLHEYKLVDVLYRSGILCIICIRRYFYTRVAAVHLTARSAPQPSRD
jgi:hypothetical protein